MEAKIVTTLFLALDSRSGLTTGFVGWGRSYTDYPTFMRRLARGFSGVWNSRVSLWLVVLVQESSGAGHGCLP